MSLNGVNGMSISADMELVHSTLMNEELNFSGDAYAAKRYLHFAMDTKTLIDTNSDRHSFTFSFEDIYEEITGQEF